MLDYQITARKYEKINKLFNDLFKDFDKHMANVGAFEVKQSIYAQTGEWRKLSKSTIAIKARKHLDPRILIATGEYAESIRARKISGMWTIAPDDKHRKIGLWLEYGTKKMPARPHFRPIVAKIQKDMVNLGAGYMHTLGRAIEVADEHDEIAFS